MEYNTNILISEDNNEMNKKEFKNLSEGLIDKGNIELLLQIFKEKLNSLESKKLSILTNGKFRELQNNLALISAMNSRFKNNELLGLSNSEENELQFAKLIKKCIALKDEIIGESEFFNDNLPKKENSNNPVVKSDSSALEELFNRIEISYIRKNINKDSTNILFLTILPENENYQTKDVFEMLIQQQRIVKMNDSYYYLSNTNFKCSKSIENGNINDYFSPIVCVLNSMYLPNSIQLLKFLNYVKFYSIIAVFCIIYDEDDSACESIVSLLKSHNILVETIGGMYQVQNVSLETTSGLQELIEKIFLECEMLG